MRVFNPEPTPGLRAANFRKVCENGFGDRDNSYAHSMAWFKGHLFVGTSRATLCLLRAGMTDVKIDTWPVDCSYPVYSPKFEQTQARAEIWRYNPLLDHWRRVYKAPLVIGQDGTEMSRDLGYRCMVVFQGQSDPEPVLYVATWARSRNPGNLILRSEDGVTFEPVSKPGLIGVQTTSTRVLIPFKGRLFSAPTGAAGGNHNASGVCLVYESRDPAQGQWQVVSVRGFGDPTNVGIFEMASLGDHLYAGTFNNDGLQIWRTAAEGEPPYVWTQVLSHGVGRGSTNQIAVSMQSFKGALYIGTGIQKGGYDPKQKIGPAGAEVIRLQADGSWDLVVGNSRQGKHSLSGLQAGFNSHFCGNVWKMCVHEGWLYASTQDWAIFLRFNNLAAKPSGIARVLQQIGVEQILDNQGGFDLWRTYDGENWLPVTRQGFGNPYNHGARTLISTPHGLFLGTANQFGPRVATQVGEPPQWTYVDNPDGGLEVWQGHLSKPGL